MNKKTYIATACLFFLFSIGQGKALTISTVGGDITQPITAATSFPIYFHFPMNSIDVGKFSNNGSAGSYPFTIKLDPGDKVKKVRVETGAATTFGQSITPKAVDDLTLSSPKTFTFTTEGGAFAIDITIRKIE